MKKLKRIRAKFKGDKVFITAHRYAARGRYAIHDQLVVDRVDLRRVLNDPAVASRLLLRESSREADTS